MHALGLNRGGIVYRNLFVAGPGHSDMPTLESLVSKGYMMKETSPLASDFHFYVTREGKEALERHWSAPV